MLLVRVFLFAVFAGNALGDPRVNLLTISLMILVLLIAWVKIGRVYRNSLVHSANRLSIVCSNSSLQGSSNILNFIPCRLN